MIFHLNNARRLLSPCLSRIGSTGLHWNVNGVSYAGTGVAGVALNQLSFPTGIFMNSNDTLYIDDASNYRVVSYLINATTGTVVAGGNGNGAALNQLGGGARYNYVDSNGSIYIVDLINSRIVRWASGGATGVVVAGNNGVGAGLNQFNSPYGVWVDSSSNVFVSESSNQRVTQWAPGATTGILVAGITGLSGNLKSRTTTYCLIIAIE
jgi:sugar lactone lactonase YvrE